VKVMPSRNRGFTLLETAVALFILSFALTGLASLTKSNVQSNAQARYFGAAGALAQQKLEDLRAGGYTAAASSVSAESLTEAGGATGTTLLSRSWTVTAGALANTKNMTATVSWTDTLGTHQVQLQTILAK
jgi:prepilin-type N-terminal cleavage/methylation domain-containing protein